ncbi:hypothetical protein [Naasia lichenicola]|uniref:Uncharacterized protein n=1 Tax=Naasia lichenicola TaxID=2565933 RepID=A0A4S4FID5_9MICO|nr:hypothetical protein [Naasia lichenicola]THG29602.1 hypothetical protein E6C64_13055 [Naasia lichenicola]
MSAAVAHLRREVPLHAVMLATMAAAAASGSPIASIGASVLLIGISVPSAALSRARPFLRPHLLDLWAMALGMLALLPRGDGRAHHVMMIGEGWAFLAVALGWALGRAWLARSSRESRRLREAASLLLTGAGLAAMVLLCAA